MGGIITGVKKESRKNETEERKTEGNEEDNHRKINEIL